MTNLETALFLLAQRYCERSNKKGKPKNWYFTRKGSRNRKYICHICNKDICSEIASGPKTWNSQEELLAHGRNHLSERGLLDFVG